MELDGYTAEQGETTAGGSVLTFAYDSSALAEFFKYEQNETLAQAVLEKSSQVVVERVWLCEHAAQAI